MRSCIAFGADEPEATAAQQLQPDSDAPQPGPIGEAIIVRISKSRRCPPTRGPLAQPLEPGLLESGAWRAVTDADDEREEEEAMTTSLLSLGAVCSALEVAGVPIERAKLPSLADLRRVITLPGGGKPGSAQRARLRDVGAAIVKAICAAVNPDGALVEQLIVEALTPHDPLDERQRRAGSR